MTYKEFLRRWAFETVEPTGERLASFHNAKLCFEIATLTWVMAAGKGRRPKFETFLDDWWGETTSRATGGKEMQEAILKSLGLSDCLKLLEAK